jgi:hypothetical protein
MFGLAVGAGMVMQSVVVLSVYMGTKTRGTKNAICMVCGLPILLFHRGRGYCGIKLMSYTMKL